MKRGGPLPRRTPLNRGKGLKRGVPQAARRTAIPPKRSKPRRRDRDDQNHGILWSDVRLVIYVRAGGRCEVCGVQLNIVNMEGHHRRRRRISPDCPCNAIALCERCHRGPDGVHNRPMTARALGRILWSEDKTPPAELPVEIYGRGRVLLACDGGVNPCPAE